MTAMRMVTIEANKKGRVNDGKGNEEEQTETPSFDKSELVEKSKEVEEQRTLNNIENMYEQATLLSERSIREQEGNESGGVEETKGSGEKAT